MDMPACAAAVAAGWTDVLFVGRRFCVARGCFWVDKRFAFVKWHFPGCKAGHCYVPHVFDLVAYHPCSTVIYSVLVYFEVQRRWC